MEAEKASSSSPTPPKMRDLSARYGGKSGKPGKYADDIIPPITVKHPVFARAASVGFAALYTELLFFIHSYYADVSGQLSGLAWAVWPLFFLLAFFIFYSSFSLPHRLTRRKFELYSPIVFLVNQLTIAAGMILGITALTLIFGGVLVGDKPGAVAELLRSLALYAIVLIVLFHGLIVFVRYVRYLYEREMHESYKIVSFLGVTAGIVMVVTLYLLQFDLGRMNGVTGTAGWLSLHLTARDLVLMTLTFFAIGWTATGIADH